MAARATVDSLLESAEDSWRREAYEEALAFLDEAVALGPAHAPCYYLRGQLRRQLYDLEGAARDLERAIRLDGDDEAARLALTLVFREMEEEKDAPMAPA